jgi:hypothetical protein
MSSKSKEKPLQSFGRLENTSQISLPVIQIIMSRTNVVCTLCINNFYAKTSFILPMRREQTMRSKPSFQYLTVNVATNAGRKFPAQHSNFYKHEHSHGSTATRYGNNISAHNTRSTKRAEKKGFTGERKSHKAEYREL